MFRWEAIEGEKDIAILLETFARLWILGSVFFNEGIERFVSVFARLGHPNLMNV